MDDRARHIVNPGCSSEQRLNRVFGPAAALAGSGADRCQVRSLGRRTLLRPTARSQAGGRTRLGAVVAGNGIIVGVDASADARAALWWAVDEAGLRGSTLLLVHAAALDGAQLAGVGASRRGHEQAGESLLAECAVAASDRQPGVLVSRVLSRIAAADELIALSAKAELLVLGTRGRPGSFDTILGSVGHQVAAQAGCPVVLVADSPTVEAKLGAPGIVVAVSDAPEGRLALGFAFREAHRRGIGIIAVSGWPLPDDDFGVDKPTLTADRSRHYGALLEAELGPWRRQFAEVAVQPVVDARGSSTRCCARPIGLS